MYKPDQTKQPLSFTTESMITGIEILRGPIEQMMFGQKMATAERMPGFNRLARLSFTDPAVNQAMPGTIPLDETLILGYEKWDGTMTLHLCIRSGREACRIATGFFPDRIIILYPEYHLTLLLRTLSETEIQSIFNHVWDYPQTIQPNPRQTKP